MVKMIVMLLQLSWTWNEFCSVSGYRRPWSNWRYVVSSQ